MKSGEFVLITKETIVDIAVEELRRLEHGNIKDVKSKIFMQNKVTNWPVVMEATRASAIVEMDSAFIIYIMMNPDKWAAAFPAIVAEVSGKRELSHGNIATQHGSIWKIDALFHLISPFIPTRKVSFIRCCKRVDCNVTAVVDVSVHQEGVNARRFPSGLLVKKMDGGKSHVTWIERTEYNAKAMEEMSSFYDFIGEGSGFSAQRFLSMLQEECKRINYGTQVPPTILKIARRMMKGFRRVISDSPGTSWKVLFADKEKRVMVHPTDRKDQVVVSRAMSFFLPFSCVFVHDVIRALHMDNLLLKDDPNPLSDVDHYGLGISLLQGSFPTGARQLVKQSCVFGDGTSILLYTDESHQEKYPELMTSGFVVQNRRVGESFVTVVIQDLILADEDMHPALIDGSKEILAHVANRIVSSLGDDGNYIRPDVPCS